MIATLDDAWRWYDRVRTLARHMGRLGERFWDREDWAATLGRDDRFRYVEAGALREDANTVMSDLDDLGVLLMFSVFEAIVRDRAWTDVMTSLPGQLHPAVEHAINELKHNIENGSFGRVTEAYKSLDHNLVEKVNQVRRYRNWVAHGRRNEQPSFVTPEAAFERLTEFLARMGEATIVSGEDSDAS